MNESDRQSLADALAPSQTGDADVAVIGGGIAGVSAAIAAADAGARVTLIDPHNVLGGQATAGGTAGFCGDTRRVNRAFDEMVQRLDAMGWIHPYRPNDDRRIFELEGLAFVLQEMLCERGVDVLLHSRLVAAGRDGRTVGPLAVATASELVELRAPTIVDASGAAIVARLAALEVFHEGACRQLPMSLHFTLWDTHRPVTPKLPPNCPTWESDDELPMTSIHWFDDGRVDVKMKVIGFDAADGADLSAAEMQARRQMMGLIYYLQTKGRRGVRYDTCTLAGVSRQIGIREQCRIVGRHVLSEDEATSECVFDDAVAVGTYHLDYHWPDRLQRAGTGICTPVAPYHIPLGSLIPAGACNVLAPGRHASGDQMAMSSFRVMATCAQMGFAAGTAAALCAHEGAALDELPASRVQDRLAAGGQSLDLSDYGEYLRKAIRRREHVFGDDAPFDECHAATLALMPNARTLVAFFAGTKEGRPDTAIWLAERFEGRWSPPRRVAKIADQPHWNPVLFRAPDGRVWLFFKVGSSPRTWRTWVIVSDDDGASWTDPCELVAGDERPRGPVKNKPIVLAGGAWVAPNSLEYPDGERWDVCVDRSEDGGATWELSDVVPIDRERIAGKGAIQPTLWESAPGRVHMLARSTCGRIVRSDSDDDGRTWSPLAPTDLPNNNSGLDVAVLDDGTLAMAFNPVSENWGPRTPLTVALSDDNGHTWPRRVDIETDANGRFSYPSIIATRTGPAVAYTHNRTRIAWWLGSIEHIDGG